MNMTVIVGVDNSEASKAAPRLAAQEARWRQRPSSRCPGQVIIEAGR